MNMSAVAFTGQGSQVCGMGQDFFHAYPESREVFERASNAIQVDIARLCFSPNDLLDRTEYTQPAILTMEMAAFAALRKSYGFDPLYFAGHSLGEYSALTAAGVLRLEDAVKIVKKRGYLMQCSTMQGRAAMAAVILENLASLDVASMVAGSGAEIANFNSKDQVVISGMKEAVSAACEAFSMRYPDARIVPLNVSAPFHSRHMQAIKPTFRKFLATFNHAIDRTKVSRVLSNYTGSFHSASTVLNSLVRQISAPVRWLENMHLLDASGAAIYEIGPQRVLAKFFSSIGVDCKAIVDARSLERHMGGAREHGI